MPAECGNSPLSVTTDLSTARVLHHLSLPGLAESGESPTSFSDLSTAGTSSLSDPAECSKFSAPVSSSHFLPNGHLSLSSLCLELDSSRLPTGWTIVASDSTNLIICDHFGKGYPPLVKYTMTVSESLTWSLHVFRQQVDIVKLFPSQPRRFECLSDLLMLLQHLNKVQICFGNSELEILQLAASKKGILLDRYGM